MQSWPSETRSPEGASEANVVDVFDGPAELRLVADGQVVTLLADQHLADGFPPTAVSTAS